VFISYKSDNRGFAGLLAAKLADYGIDSWWDGKLELGSDYQSEIRHQQQHSDCTIVVWSSDSIRSTWVRAEAEWARSKGCLIPLRIDHVDLWPPFSLLQTVDLISWEGESEHSGWNSLLRDINQFTQPIAPQNAEIARMGHLIHKLKAKDSTGKPAYYFVLVEPPHEEAFLEAIEGDGVIDLEHFGKVIASCYGETPNPDTRAFLKEPLSSADLGRDLLVLVGLCGFRARSVTSSGVSAGPSAPSGLTSDAVFPWRDTNWRGRAAQTPARRSWRCRDSGLCDSRIGI